MSNAAESNALILKWSEAYLPPDFTERLRVAAETEALTPLAMFMDADMVVKSVMALLVVFSVLSWAIWAAKILQTRMATGRLRRDFRRLTRHGRLGARISRFGALGRMQRAAQTEITQSQGLGPSGIKERTAMDLVRIEAGAARAMQSGVTVIGSIGSTAPFVGLFGTVWGIMNAFISISESGSTNLSVVAPGIAEALLATAIGLVAAIPAVILYNHLSRVIGRYRVRLADAASLVLRTQSRDLDRAATDPEPDDADANADADPANMPAEPALQMAAQ
ncbi:MAG: tonB-system energizer ExbB [Mangrovicoccus sp.]